jgi:hypothetical protein
MIVFSLLVCLIGLIVITVFVYEWSKVAPLYVPPVFVTLLYILAVSARSRIEDTPFAAADAVIEPALKQIIRYVTPALLFSYALLLYLSIYQILPQVFGGPQPRCAYADLAHDGSSKAVARALFSRAW